VRRRELTRIGFPVWSKAIHAQDAVKKRLSWSGSPIASVGALIGRPPNMTMHIPDDGALLEMVPRIAASAEPQQRLLVDNLHRLYWGD
jgi:hypothetical protein